MNSKIERKCHDEKGKWLNGIFHGFFQIDAGPGEVGPVAVIEMSDGKVTTMNAESIVFDAQETEKVCVWKKMHEERHYTSCGIFLNFNYCLSFPYCPCCGGKIMEEK